MDNSCKEKKKRRLKSLKSFKRLKRGLGLFLSAAVVCNTLLFDASTVFAEEVQEQELCGVEAAEEDGSVKIPETDAKEITEEAVKEAAAEDETAPDEAARDEAAPNEAVKDEAAPDEAVKDEVAPNEAVKDETAPNEAVKDETAPNEAVKDEAAPDEPVKDEAAPDEAAKDEAALDEPVKDGAAQDEPIIKEETAQGEAAEEETTAQEGTTKEDTGLCAHHKKHTAECGYSSPSEEGAGSPCTYVCRICPIEELTAALPEADDVSGDNAEEVQAQLEKILALYTELTEEEQEQADISRCLALQEALELLAGQGRAKTPALVLDAVSYLDCDANGKNWETKTCSEYAEISESTTAWNNGWYVAGGAVTISKRVAVTGDVHLILTNGCTLEAADGITVNDGDSLTIYAQPEEADKAAGSLTATATGDHNAGIGGVDSKSGGTITINGGKIKAVGSDSWSGAGIGGGYFGSGGTITINGGVVEASGGSQSSAGIGGGSLGSGGKITINGGKVTAKAFGTGAGIGSGSDGGSGGEITINGGEVNATGTGGAGIGGGSSVSGGKITINGGKVTAAGGESGAGIGGGYHGDGGEVTIKGGTITATGGRSGAGIGGGKEAAGGKITIVGGTVHATRGYSSAGYVGSDIGGGYKGSDGTVFIGGGTVKKGEGEPETYYTVLFEVPGVSDVNVPAQGIAAGKTAAEPSLEMEGHSISGWYKDEAYMEPFDFASEKIGSNLTLYAKLKANTDHAVEVTIGDAAEPDKYTTIDGAFTAISGKTGVIKINVLQDVTAAKTLTVGTDMEVTVEMAEDVTFTNTTKDCFQVDGGTLTLTGGKVVEGAAGKSVVYAASGTLCITGGTYESKGNGLWISDGAEVRLSGGTIGASDTALRYESRKLKEMLDTQEDQCAAFYDKNGEVATEILEQNTAKGTYTVKRSAGHEYEWRDDGTQHYNYCRGCGREKDHGCHVFKDGVCTVCSIEAVARVTAENEETGYYASIAAAWEALQGKTATMTILKQQSLTDSMQMTNPNTDVTVEMADGVRIDSTSDFFIVKMGKLTINSGSYVSTEDGKSGIYMTDGSVVMNGGTIEMQGAYWEQEKGIQINGSGTLTISGGELKATGSNGVALLVDKGTVTLTGGTLTGTDNNQALVISDSIDQNIGSLLGKGLKIFKSEEPLGGDELQGKTLEAGTYTVARCLHRYGGYTHTKGTTVHERKCDFCGDVVQTPCRYEWSDGQSKAACSVCNTSCLTISATGTEGLVYDGEQKKPSVAVTLDDGSTLTEGYTVTYADNINAGNGTASVIVKGEVFEGTFTRNFSIGKAKGTLTVPAVSVEKTFGEADFPLNCTTNGDGQISYTSDKEAVAAVLADGTVQIKGAGTAKITISLAEGRNYTKAADAAVTVSVAKNGTYRVEEINRRYLYTREHTGEVDLAALLPKDCGTATYQTPSTSGNAAWKTASVDTEGKLSYTLANGNTGDKGTITVAVQTQNYEDITITVNVELTDRMPVSIKEGGEVTLKDDTLTYGETLSKLTFNEAVFVDSSMHDVAGALAWKNPSEMPEAGTVSATWVFTPSDDQYEILEGVIAITVRKAGAAPNLPDNAIEAPEGAEKVGDIPLPEGWEWQDADKETPLVPGMPVTAVAVYTGADKGNYETAAQTVTITKPDRSHTGLWVSGLRQSVPYTGSAVTQENIKVYHNSTLLQEKKEYTISYKNNKNAGTAKLIVTGKGNYTGKVPQEFTIEHIDLGAEAQNHISAAVATAAATGKRLKPAVTVTWNGKKLKEKKDYTLSYDANITSASADGYDVTINGVGNYSGSIVRKFRVVPKGTKLLNSAKVSGLAKSYPYRNAGDSAGDAVPDGLEDDLAKLSVKVGKTTLTQGTDYTVRMENIGAVGTAAIIIEPAAGSSYAGEKRVPVSIKGTDLKKCSITGLEGAYPYTGAPVIPEIAVFTGKNGSGTQISADAYTIRYANNTKPGKATVTVTGIAEKGYSGTLKATYTIGRADLKKGETAGTITIRIPDTVSYAKGGAKPKPVVMYTEGSASYTLRESIDYKLKYKNNTALSEGASRQPMVSITGIGNYSGTVTKNFAVTRQDIGLLTIAAADKAYSARKKGSAYYSAPKVYDLDGKLLKPKKDYTVRYTDDATGSEIDRTSVIENGTKIRVTITATQKAKSGYSGTLSTTYLVRGAESVKDITKAKADKISPQSYTGEPIIPELKLYITTGQTKTYLIEGEDYEIVGCYDNIQKGTATILIKGKDTGGCSGIKAVTFKITAADNAKIWSGVF